MTARLLSILDLAASGKLEEDADSVAFLKKELKKYVSGATLLGRKCADAAAARQHNQHIQEVLGFLVQWLKRREWPLYEEVIKCSRNSRPPRACCVFHSLCRYCSTVTIYASFAVVISAGTSL